MAFFSLFFRNDQKWKICKNLENLIKNIKTPEPKNYLTQNPTPKKYIKVTKNIKSHMN